MERLLVKLHMKLIKIFKRILILIYHQIKLITSIKIKFRINQLKVYDVYKILLISKIILEIL